MNAPVIPLGCAVAGCGQTRRNHTNDDHRYQVPDWPTIRDRAAALKTERVNTCDTCELPEDRWPVSDPLYLPGGIQCPDCTRHDLNEEATRKHAEVNQ